MSRRPSVRFSGVNEVREYERESCPSPHYIHGMTLPVHSGFSAHSEQNGQVPIFHKIPSISLRWASEEEVYEASISLANAIAAVAVVWVICSSLFSK